MSTEVATAGTTGVPAVESSDAPGTPKSQAASTIVGSLTETDGLASVGDTEAAWQFSEWFIERFADYWQTAGASRIEGRIAGYLLLSESPGVSAEELADTLGASRGSVSTYTRRLVERGFVRRVRRSGDRAHYFVMDADVWGGFLDNEQAYLESQRQLATEALQHTDPSGPAYTRVLNMRDYMGWIIDNRMLRSEWIRFKAERDAAPPANPPTV